MEIKNWTYEEYPSFDEEIEGTGYEKCNPLYENLCVRASCRCKLTRAPGTVPEIIRGMLHPRKNVRLYLLEGADHGGSEFWTEEIQEIVMDFLNAQKESFTK